MPVLDVYAKDRYGRSFPVPCKVPLAEPGLQSIPVKPAPFRHHLVGTKLVFTPPKLRDGCLKRVAKADLPKWDAKATGDKRKALLAARKAARFQNQLIAQGYNKLVVEENRLVVEVAEATLAARKSAHAKTVRDAPAPVRVEGRAWTAADYARPVVSSPARSAAGAYVPQKQNTPKPRGFKARPKPPRSEW